MRGREALRASSAAAPAGGRPSTRASRLCRARPAGRRRSRRAPLRTPVRRWYPQPFALELSPSSCIALGVAAWKGHARSPHAELQGAKLRASMHATAMGRPVLLSVGYAACHWCHVMAHESFEDEGVAAVMNELFVNIKVDREERPDVDHIYMSALHLLGEQGGWPLTMFLTPEGEPFWGGTYFPREPRFGRPGFVAVLREIDRLYRAEPERILKNRDAIKQHLARADTSGGGT